MQLHLDRLGRDRFANADVLFACMTRFDVRMSNVPGAAKIGDRHEWTRHRADAFRRWCLPSMLAQEPRPHAWAVCFDEDLTEATAALIADLAPHEGVYPVLTGDRWYPDAKRQLLEAARANHGDRFSLVCCSRLDSDDAFHVRFHAACDEALLRLRKSPTFGPTVCLDFPYVVVADGSRVMPSPRSKVAFATVEPIARFGGPMAFAHTRVDEHHPLVEVFTDRPSYCYRKHGRNISGPWSGSHPAFAQPGAVLSWFGQEPEGGWTEDVGHRG